MREAYLDLPARDSGRRSHLVAIEGLSYQEASDPSVFSLGTLMSRIGRPALRLRDIGTRVAPEATTSGFVGDPK